MWPFVMSVTCCHSDPSDKFADKIKGLYEESMFLKSTLLTNI